MFLGRNRFMGGPANEAGQGPIGQNFESVNQSSLPMPNGIQRYLAKKGINSSNDLFNRLQNAPRIPFLGKTR